MPDGDEHRVGTHVVDARDREVLDGAVRPAVVRDGGVRDGSDASDRDGSSTPDRDAARSRVMAGMTAWTVLVAQYNGMVADRLGITQTELRCLYVLAHHGPSTPGVLARHVDLTSGAATRMIDRLEAAGHIRRVRDPHDRRRVVVEPAPDSLDLVAAQYRPLDDRLHAHLEPLTDHELRRFGDFFAAAEASTDDLLRNPPSDPAAR